MHIGVKIVEGLMRLLARQPLKVHYFWGRLIARLIAGPLHYRRDVAVINIARSFPDKRYGELKTIIDGFYRHFGRVVAETLWFAGGHDTRRLRDSHICEMEDVQVLNDLYNIGKGVIVLNSHFGNWELLGGVMHYIYPPDKADFSEEDFTVVYKKLDNRFWNEVLGDCRRSPIAKEHYRTCYIESKEIMRFVLSRRNTKHIYVFPTDQCPYWYATAHKIDNFMHQPTLTMTGAAALAQKLGMAVCYMSLRNREDYGYKMVIREICRDASSSSPEEIMNTFYKMLEEDINAQPSNYMWTHKRWKK